MSATALSPRPKADFRAGLLSVAFSLFSGLRIVAYLPTLAALLSAGQTDQHSLFSWVIFLGANGTMALWLLEHNGGRFNHAVLVSAVNALMCGAIAATIVWQRWGQLLF